MCLARLKDFKVSKNYGWKVFFEADGKLYGEIFSTDKERKINRWLDSDDYLGVEGSKRIMCSISYEIYSSGWHIFLRKKDAKRWAKASHKLPGRDLVIRKVLFKEVVAKGEQIHCRVVVAKKIKILPQKKKTRR